MELKYEFEEVQVLGPGVMAWGTATLRPVGDGYQGEFYVSEITFKGGKTISRRDAYAKEDMASHIFRVVARRIENSRDAEITWIEYEQEFLANA